MKERNPRQVNTAGRWLLSCLLFFCMGCSHQAGVPAITVDEANLFYKRVDSVKPHIRHGDLIFRNGTDEVSRAARSMNRMDTSFSHCGIILVENDSIQVYHAIGGHYNPSQHLRREPLDSFLLPGEADRFAIYRYHLSQPQTDTLAAVVRSHYQARLPFDLYFNMLTDDRMYCSEFVFKCLNRSTSNSLASMIAAREWPYGISPDDLYMNGKTTLVKRVDFFLPDKFLH